ncbi:MAG: adenosine deaminase [Candidatus Eisenbacteria bacterium RBG_16_71_46]|nr:MAG: adenosine deaminase [Candidatus Eisenbacteria bacterium RBG_16_71_46]OGF23059.1 MAG: adenosine deaminase [Candidatus Eisenbacteria bacterium RBG_19FT_COMBO_70_11]
MRLSQRVLERLPKTDIHCHLDGCLRPRTMLELAVAQGVRLPTKNLTRLTRHLQAGRRTRSLADYLKIFNLTLSVMQDREALYRVAHELAEDAAAENVRHLEVRYSPILHRKRRLSYPDIVESVVAGLAEGGRKHNLSTGVIICGIRSMPPRHSLMLAELAVAYKGRGVLGFDLAGQEKDYPAKAHRAAFELVLKNNVNVTVHGGEAFGPASISQALHYCGAHRIGHGTRLLEDPDLLRYVNDHRIPLEVCLSSNVQTRTVRSFKDHPLGFYFRQGLRVTLNTDSRLISATTVSRELGLAARAFGLSPYEIKRILIMGFKSAFLPYARKARLVRDVSLEIDRIFMEEFPQEYDWRATSL